MGTATAWCWRSAIVLLTVMVAGGCTDPLSPPPARPAFELRTLDTGGHRRMFYLVPPVPAGGQVGRPLLLIYHGAGGSGLDLMNGTKLASEGQRAGMVVAFLEAVEGYGARWAVNPSDLEIVDDLEFTRAVVDTIDREFPVDRRRIFAAGYSRGGDLVYHIACRDPAFLRAGAAVASTTLNSLRDWCEETVQSAVQPSISIVLGSADPLMPWEGGVATRMAAVESAEYWGARNGCRSGAPTEQTLGAYSGYRLKRFSFDPCARAELRLYRIEPLGHNWPNIAFDVDRMLVDWFSSQAARP